jgi:restriction system protein
VQAKHWRSQRVSVQPVRELYGIQRAMGAERSMFVAMGRYTADVQQFAAQVGKTLVDGDALLRIIGAGLEGSGLVLPAPEGPTAPACPACGGAMVLRTGRRGLRAGQDFFGCTLSCVPGTVALPDEVVAGR